eukprot:TRINITY_DN10786_c0_g3_i1.p1 TRINITY_DN10786_c0_g3~~TRINITY_DN10786_c0_g3_i1.p1  ORF type:complete len:168 (+),score=28.53 TRINITY_DN10786_c0_g3_i1:40-543(+)
MIKLFLVIFSFFGVLLAQQPLLFALQYSGSCSSGACLLGSQSQDLESLINSVDGIQFTLSTSIGSKSLLYLFYNSTGPNSFTESGNVTFGTHLAINHALEFSSVVDGTTMPSLQTGTSFGQVVYKVTRGLGGFSGAVGFITSNVLLFDSGLITANVFGNLMLPSTKQ